MIKAAEQTLDGSPGHVRLARIEDVAPPAGPLDLITARLALHYVADVGRVIAVAARGLVSDGRFIFSVVHPVLTSYDNEPTGPRTTWTVDDYFETGPRARQWLGAKVTWHHRTIEHYVDAVVNAGLTVAALRECEPDPTRFDGHLHELARRRRVPLFLLVHARR